MTMGVLAANDSIFGGRSAATGLQRWLEQVPPGARGLVIVLRERESSGGETLARWPLPDCDPGAWSVIAGEWAQRAHAMVSDCAQESRATAHAVVRWVDEHGQVLAARRLSVPYQGGSEDDAFTREATTSAALGQLMSHQQVLMDNLTAVTQYTVVESAKRADHAYDRLVELQSENYRLRSDLEKLRAEQIQDEADRVIAESVERDPAMEQAEQLLKAILLKYLAGQGQSAKLPPQSPEPPPE